MPPPKWNPGFIQSSLRTRPSERGLGDRLGWKFTEWNEWNVWNLQLLVHIHFTSGTFSSPWA